MSRVREELPRTGWFEFLDRVTQDHRGADVTIEVLSQEFGDQHQAEHLPFAYIEYDPKDDAATVGVGGRDGRYPVVMAHRIPHPQRVLADPPVPEAARAFEIVGDDGSQTIVTLYPRNGRSA